MSKELHQHPYHPLSDSEKAFKVICPLSDLEQWINRLHLLLDHEPMEIESIYVADNTNLKRMNKKIDRKPICVLSEMAIGHIQIN